MTDHAKTLRQAPTDAEARLWRRLRNAQLGVKFRRQHRIAGYIFDFACVERSLAIELDGSQHFDQAAYDARRTAAIERLGFKVLRFWNNDALQRTDDVLERIVAALNQPSPPHPNPLPRLRRGRGGRINSNINRNGNSNGSGNRDGCSSSLDLPTPSPPTAASLGERVGVRGQAPHARSDDDGSAKRRHAALRLRARLYALIRTFFSDRGIAEVETPIMSAAGNTEPNIDGFSTGFTGPVAAGARERFLRTSPEYPLKRLLAEGHGDCYELGRVFRNGEAGASHNPEFTMLEWYRVGFDHRRLMLECAQFVRAALALVGRDADVQVTSYRDWFREALRIDPFTAAEAALREPLAEFRIDPQGLTRDDWLDLLVTHRLQTGLARDAITIVYDFPASQCSLAKIRPCHPPVAERFELYLGTEELANGYHELNDATEQRARFEHDNARRRARGQRELPLDENLLAVLDHLPQCAGVALGVDRLLMHMLGSDDIRDVLAFPFDAA